MAQKVSHDQNFKNLILDYPRQALEFFVPDEAPTREDQVEITPIRQEQLQERLGGPYRELDVPLKVEWLDGRRDMVLFVVEEETDWRRFSPHRLAIYCLNLSEHFKTHRVVPVVIFLREADSETMEFSLHTEGSDYLTFKYQVCQLKSIPFERWQNSNNLVARLNLPNMRHTADQNALVYHKAIQGLTALEPDGNKQVKYLDFIDIYSELTDNEIEQWQQQYPEERSTMTRFAERFRDEGIQQGMQQGGRELLERLLQRRFGPLTPDITEKLAKASTVELETWADNVLDAENLEDVFNPNRYIKT